MRHIILLPLFLMVLGCMPSPDEGSEGTDLNNPVVDAPNEPIQQAPSVHSRIFINGTRTPFQGESVVAVPSDTRIYSLTLCIRDIVLTDKFGRDVVLPFGQDTRVWHNSFDIISWFFIPKGDYIQVRLDLDSNCGGGSFNSALELDSFGVPSDPNWGDALVEIDEPMSLTFQGNWSISGTGDVVLLEGANLSDHIYFNQNSPDMIDELESASF